MASFLPLHLVIIGNTFDAELDYECHTLDEAKAHKRELCADGFSDASEIKIVSLLTQGAIQYFHDNQDSDNVLAVARKASKVA